jgi:hypothetical protein
MYRALCICMRKCSRRQETLNSPAPGPRPAGVEFKFELKFLAKEIVCYHIFSCSGTGAAHHHIALKLEESHCMMISFLEVSIRAQHVNIYIVGPHGHMGTKI